MTASDSILSPYTIQIDGHDAASWSSVLRRFDDATIYQSWAYGQVRWGAKALSHIVLRRGERPIAAAQVRIARLPVLPVGVAYVRWGPLVRPAGEQDDPSALGAIMEALHAEYVRRRGLDLQVVPNAFEGTTLASRFSAAFHRLEMVPDPGFSRYRTVRVPLGPDVNDLRRRLQQKWRNQLNASERKALVLEVRDDDGAYRTFLGLYREMWARKQFDTTVDVDEFARIHAALAAGQKLRIFLALSEGAAVAAVVCSIDGDGAIYLLGATNEKARENKASYFLHWQVMLWLKNRGIHWYDMGGIDPELNPGGYHFKIGLNGDDVTQMACHVHQSGNLNRLARSVVTWRRRRQVQLRQPVPATASTDGGR